MPAYDAVAHRVIRGTATSSLKLGEERTHPGHRISVETHPEQTSRKKISCRQSRQLQASVQLRYVRQKILQFLEEAGQAGVLLQQDMILPR
jgi:hypothetical protein